MMDIALHALHLLAGALWVGGMLFTGGILGPVLRRDVPPAVRLPMVQTVGRRFSRAGWAALAVLALTGLHRVRYLLFCSPRYLTATPYGRLLSLKLGLFATMLSLSLWHDFSLGPALIRLADRPASPEFKAASRRLAFWARVNVLLVVAIVVIAAALRLTKD